MHPVICDWISAITPMNAAPATECHHTLRKIGPTAWARSRGSS
jgi:hypothetical protein